MGTLRKTYKEVLSEISELLFNIQKHMDLIKPPKLLEKSRPLSPVANQKIAVLAACQHYLQGTLSGSMLVKILQDNPKYVESGLLKHSMTKELVVAACSISRQDIKLVNETLVVDKCGFVYEEKTPVS